MASIVPNPSKIKAFRSEPAFEKWLAIHHARETELWLKIHQKDSALVAMLAKGKTNVPTRS